MSWFSVILGSNLFKISLKLRMMYYSVVTQFEIVQTRLEFLTWFECFVLLKVTRF